MLNAHWSVFCFCFASVRCTYSSVSFIYFNLFNLFNMEMEWSYAKTLQLIELYEERPYLCDKVAKRGLIYVATSNWTIAAYATLFRNFIAHSRDKIAQENCRCDISLSHSSAEVVRLNALPPVTTPATLLSRHYTTTLAVHTFYQRQPLARYTFSSF